MATPVLPDCDPGHDAQAALLAAKEVLVVANGLPFGSSLLTVLILS